MAGYWAKLNCKATKGSGGVSGIGTGSKTVQAGKQVTFTPDFNISTGGTLGCEICFESFGSVPFPKPGGGVEYKIDKTCKTVESYEAKRPCKCNDFKDSSKVPYQSQCAANETQVNTQNLYGSAGSCKVCRTCNYPDPNLESSWEPAKSTRCDGKTFTQTTKSFAAYPTSTSKHYLGCPTKTRQATGTTTPDYNADDICAGVTVSQSPTNCIGDAKQITGTKQPDWSEWVEVGTGNTYDFSQLCEEIFKSMTRYDKNACKNDEYQSFYGQIPTSDPQCCNCHPGWSRTMPTDCVGDVEQEAPPSSYGVNGCDICYKCGEECEEDDPGLPGIWAFNTSIPGACADTCSGLMAAWSGGITGWGSSACGDGGGHFYVSNKSCTKALKITVTIRPNMTVTLQDFQIGGQMVAGGSGGSFTFTIPPNCRTPLDIGELFSATYNCSCVGGHVCRGGWVAQAPTYSYVDV